MEKFKKYMDILDKVLNALKIAALVASVVLAVLAVVGFIGIPDVVIGEVDTTLDMGSLELELSDALVSDSAKINNLLAASSLILSCQFVITFVMIRILQKLITPMKDGNIFHPAVAQNIKNLAIYVLAGGFLTEIINFVGSILLLSVYDISSLLNTDTVINHSVSFEMNGDFVVYAGILYLLSYVFKYGAELQTQVDETL